MNKSKQMSRRFPLLWASLLLVVFFWTDARSTQIQENKVEPVRGVAESKITDHKQPSTGTGLQKSAKDEAKSGRSLSSKGKMKKITPAEVRKLEESCLIWLRTHVQTAATIKIRPKDPQKYCRCFARNFTAVSETKDNPMGEMNYFTEYFAYRLTQEEVDQMGDYFYAMEDIATGCLEDLNFKLEL